MENINIIKKKENPLFNREEIQISVKADITPSNAEIEKLIADKFSTKIENIKIKKIDGKFGSKTFTITANVYASEEDKNKTEIKTKKQKKAEADTSGKEKVKEENAEQSSQKEDSSLTSSNQSSEPASEQSKE